MTSWRRYLAAGERRVGTAEFVDILEATNWLPGELQGSLVRLVKAGVVLQSGRRCIKAAIEAAACRQGRAPQTQAGLSRSSMIAPRLPRLLQSETIHCRVVACGGRACLVDPRYHVVLAVKGLRARGASACGLRPSSNPDGCAAPWCSGLGQSRPTQTGVRHVVVPLLPPSPSMHCWCAMSMVSTVRACRGGAVPGAARVLSQRVRRGATMSSPQAVKDHICAWRSAVWSTRCSACCSWMRSTGSSR